MCFYDLMYGLNKIIQLNKSEYFKVKSKQIALPNDYPIKIIGVSFLFKFTF